MDFEFDELLSEDEEDYLDLLLSGELVEERDENDEQFDPSNPHQFSQSQSPSSSQTLSQSTDSSASQDPVAGHIYWRDQNDNDDGVRDPRLSMFKPRLPPGIQLGLLTRQAVQAFQKPVDFFLLFLTQEIVLQICIATNHHAEALLSKGQNLSYANSMGTWTRVTVEEMYRFVGILIYVSIVNFQTLERYWSTCPLYKNNVVSSVMSITRFKAILSFLQINADSDKDDKLTRIRHLLEHVESISQSLFQPYESVSVDERMVASKHHYSGIRQFIRDKPIRFGLKLWVLADSITGYTYAFFVYLGKKRTELKNKTKGLAYNVVMELSRTLFNQGYRIYTDSFYTTQHLATDLLQKKTYLVGAVKRSSSAMPSCLKDIELFEKVSTRGDFRWHRDGDFVYVQWRDCKTVTIISPIHKGSATGNCQRTVNERSGYKRKQLMQPVVIKDYNTNMGGVDKSNQMLNKYPCYIKSIFHWWKVLFFHSIDIMIVNSYIIMKEFMKCETESSLHRGSGTFGHLEYRESLALSLMNLDGDQLRVPANVCKVQCLPMISVNRKDCIYCNGEASLKEQKLPSTKTQYFCAKCEVPLCLQKERNCFLKWHSPEGRTVQDWAKTKGRKRKL
ncbi:piggyBac transposable element-derived protein 4-like [Saccostrea cucullata]|uniref:piggyBac transposable element-derived protein 4-like n=1 Tax=Saccostrea cuccullata TaxID=36930 RepID=UPI002ED4B260